MIITFVSQNTNLKVKGNRKFYFYQIKSNFLMTELRK